MSKLLTVFGATGNQGGSVIKAVLADAVLSKEYKIRGITRDVTKPAAQALTAQGVEMISADMSSPESVAPAVKGAHTVFLVTNYWESKSAKVEVNQGKAVTDASKAAGVKHIIFSSLIHASKASKGRLSHIQHFDSKADIETYIRDSGVPGTFVLPGFFMSNFLGMIRKNEDGKGYTLAMPVDGDKGKAPAYDSSKDTGLFVKAAIKSFPGNAGKHIYAAADYYPLSRIVSEFSEVIGKPASYVHISDEEFKSRLPEGQAQELLENFQLLDEPGYYAGASLKESLELVDEKPTSWKEFVEKNKQHWL